MENAYLELRSQSNCEVRHSTLSRTRKRLPAAVFEVCFQHILTACIEADMVSGHTQVVDAAFVEANASLDTFKRKALLAWQLLKGEAEPINDADLAGIKPPFTTLEKTDKPIKKGRNNATHQSLTDTDARINQKPGKPTRLYYLSTIAVDSYRHVITHIQADLADERDSKHLMEIANKLSGKLKQNGLPFQYLLADGGFGSGENGPATSVHRLHASLEAHHIKSFISLPGSYHPLREGFHYDTVRDVYVCRNGKFLYNHGIRMEKGFANHYYHARVKDCGVCPFKQECCGNKRRQSLTFSVYRHYHKLMQERIESKEGKSMKRRRMATVEPVFGSLLNYYGMKRANAKGKQATHKMMLMAACTYNLQKLLTHIPHPKNKVQVLPSQQLIVLYFILLRVVQHPRPFTITI